MSLTEQVGADARRSWRRLPSQPAGALAQGENDVPARRSVPTEPQGGCERTLPLFGVRICDTTIPAAARWILDRAHAAEPTRIAFLNAHYVNVMHRDAQYRHAVESCDRVYADGVGMRIAAATFGVRLADNVNGTDLFPELCREAARRGTLIYLLGGRPPIAVLAARQMIASFPDLNIAGSHHGYFADAADEQRVIDAINRSGAQVLLVGMGAPIQEIWLQQNRHRLKPAVLIGVGGLFDFYSGRIPRAPLRVRQAGLEWFWRLLMEPRRLAGRYLIGNAVFLGHLARHRLAAAANGSPRDGMALAATATGTRLHSNAEPAPLSVAYVVNQYPKVSHSFIRREILELERQGVQIERISIRSADGGLVDPGDVAERERTFTVLRESPFRILRDVLSAVARQPRGSIRALIMALGLMRRSHRPAILHLAYLVEACVVARRLAAAGSTHMHAHFGTNSAEVALLAHLITGIPYSFTVHGPEEFDKPEYFGLAEKGRHAAFVCAISSFGRGQLFRWLDAADWPKVEVVRCGLDEAFTSEPPPRPQASRRFVTIGRLCEQKGQLLLIEAAALLAAEGVPFELVLGGDGEMRSAIETRAAALGIGDRVTVTGWISAAEVRELIAGARALVLPSFAEGIPVVLMEAMAMRCPVITTHVAGIPELVEHGRSGWLLPSGSVGDLARGMRECLEAPRDQLVAMGEAGRRRVLERHDIVREAAALKHLIRRSDGALATAASLGQVERKASSAGSPAAPGAASRAPA